MDLVCHVPAASSDDRQHPKDAVSPSTTATSAEFDLWHREYRLVVRLTAIVIAVPSVWLPTVRQWCSSRLHATKLQWYVVSYVFVIFHSVARARSLTTRVRHVAACW